MELDRVVTQVWIKQKSNVNLKKQTEMLLSNKVSPFRERTNIRISVEIVTWNIGMHRSSPCATNPAVRTLGVVLSFLQLAFG